MARRVKQLDTSASVELPLPPDAPAGGGEVSKIDLPPAQDVNAPKPSRRDEALLLLLMACFIVAAVAVSQYVNIIFGVPVLAALVVIVRVLAKWLGVEHYVDIAQWLGRAEKKP